VDINISIHMIRTVTPIVKSRRADEARGVACTWEQSEGFETKDPTWSGRGSWSADALPGWDRLGNARRSS